MTTVNLPGREQDVQCNGAQEWGKLQKHAQAMSVCVSNNKVGW